MKMVLALAAFSVAQSDEGIWIPRADIPIGLHHANAGSVGGKLFLLGGVDALGFTAVTYQDTLFALGPLNPTTAFLPTQTASIVSQSFNRNNHWSKKLKSLKWMGIFQGHLIDGLGKQQ